MDKVNGSGLHSIWILTTDVLIVAYIALIYVLNVGKGSWRNAREDGLWSTHHHLGPTAGYLMTAASEGNAAIAIREVVALVSFGHALKPEIALRRLSPTKLTLLVPALTNGFVSELFLTTHLNLWTIFFFFMYAIALSNIEEINPKADHSAEILKHLEKAANIDKEDAYTVHLLGVAHYKKKNYAEALSCFEKAEGIRIVEHYTQTPTDIPKRG
ncbi:hypothetical protein GCK32_018362 [Trichostrongylus colubriformis]|uniref:Uncharacterized protein n=1 Tax=Trichostrongylus colubriformis TaxID=6319 RepID=A0AAN8FE95_TRICO